MKSQSNRDRAVTGAPAMENVLHEVRHTGILSSGNEDKMPHW
jgi:hypothetical protein